MLGCYTAYTVALDFEDDAFRGRIFYLTLSTKTNTDFVMVADYCRFAVDVLTTVIDAILVLINRRRRTRWAVITRFRRLGFLSGLIEAPK